MDRGGVPDGSTEIVQLRSCINAELRLLGTSGCGSNKNMFRMCCRMFSMVVFIFSLILGNFLAAVPATFLRDTRVLFKWNPDTKYLHSTRNLKQGNPDLPQQRDGTFESGPVQNPDVAQDNVPEASIQDDSSGSPQQESGGSPTWSPAPSPLDTANPDQEKVQFSPSGFSPFSSGAGKGIGAATALLFAKHGASVVVCDLDSKAAGEVVQEIKANGGQAVAVSGDVTAQGAAEDIIAQTVAAFGPSIHILVNNAGYTWDGVVHKMKQDQWQAMLDVHCTAPFRLIQAAAPYMREVARKEMASGKGASPRNIINISSVSGTHGNAGQANYATAKAGVTGLTKAIAKEWGPFNVRCNAVAYGLIDTRLTRAKEGGESIMVGGKTVNLGLPASSNFKDIVKATTPLQRIGTVEEAAGAIMMLVCSWASYITGQVIEVNGGAFM